MSTFIRPFIKILSIATLLFIAFVVYMFTFDHWSFDKVIDVMIRFSIIGSISLLGLFILYKLFFERLTHELYRIASGKVIQEVVPPNSQVSGKKRSGKDSGTIGEARLLKERLLRAEKKRLKQLSYILYMYDMKRVTNYFDQHYRDFFVSSDFRIKEVFKSALLNEDMFINEQYKNKIDPKEHYFSWKHKSGKYVPDIPFEDGIVPGGKSYLDLLFEFVMIYIQYNYVQNFLMTNQPTIEDYSINKKTGRINKLFSKKFSQNYIRIKEDHPMPLPTRGMVIETETGIYYVNNDTAVAEDINKISGIKEFHTVFGHLFREMLWYRSITQDHKRPIKTLRELFEGYIHVFKLKFKATGEFTRAVRSFKIFRKKVRIFFYRVRLLFPKFKWQTKLYNKWIIKNKKKISCLEQKNLKRWAKGYIIFFKGIYLNEDDVSKKVKWPLFGVTKDTSGSDYHMFGFKQTNRIKDCFGLYNTHFMGTVREAKQIIHSMSFDDVENWKTQTPDYESMSSTNYSTFEELMKSSRLRINSKKLEQEANRRDSKKRWKKVEAPNLDHLEEIELYLSAVDMGVLTNDDLIYFGHEYLELSKDDLVKFITIEYNNLNKYEKPEDKTKRLYHARINLLKNTKYIPNHWIYNLSNTELENVSVDLGLITEEQVNQSRKDDKRFNRDKVIKTLNQVYLDFENPDSKKGI